MVITIRAEGIEDILADDECLIPVAEDLLLDALIEYRNTPTEIYEPNAHTTREGLNIHITIQPQLPPIISSNGNGNHNEGDNQDATSTDHRYD